MPGLLNARPYIGSGRAGSIRVTTAPVGRPAGGLTMSWSDSDNPRATCTLLPRSRVIRIFWIPHRPVGMNHANRR